MSNGFESGSLLLLDHNPEKSVKIDIAWIQSALFLGHEKTVIALLEYPKANVDIISTALFATQLEKIILDQYFSMALEHGKLDLITNLLKYLDTTKQQQGRS